MERGKFYYKPFAETSRSDQLLSLDRPVDLVGNIRALVEQARAAWKVDAEFNPSWWIRGIIDSIAYDAYSNSRAIGIRELSLREREAQKYKHDFLYALRVAWSLRTYEQLDAENSSSIYTDIRGFTTEYHTTSITLSPLGVTLLDAMAEAIDIPHTPGQATFDIYLFSGQGAEEKIKKNAPSLAPTNEEVKRAIATPFDAEK